MKKKLNNKTHIKNISIIRVEMNYQEVEFEDKFYCVIEYGKTGEKKLFIINSSDLEKITSGGNV